ncbi:N2227-like protein [Rickenella mellea]|uniref:N2227-like protein n=1 Tax=Rickenella mellea TaxID=50990 RepID=A0A4Y7PP58_9AGAM|nr:N2227-like protein [Rickenella mellea]
MLRSYSKLGRAHKRIGYDLGYTKKLDRLSEVTKINGTVTAAIAKFAYADGVPVPPPLGIPSVGGDLGRVREVLKHFVRDWSVAGFKERQRIFDPILRVLQQVSLSEHQAVLVPGCGLGRLAWEISRLGKSFDVTANELSSFMSLALRFLLSPITTTSASQYTIHPYAHWFSHQETNKNLFRGISFPDVVPRLCETFRLVEGDFLNLKALQREGGSGYDFIVTLFFIDTSLNIASTIEQIYYLLRPGGTWINLGPLLWTGGAETAVELSLDEVLKLAGIVGFVVDNASRERVPCEYTADSEAMMKWVYQAEFWVAKKQVLR